MKTKNKPTQEYIATTTDYFFALLNYPSYTKLMQNENKPYNVLLNWMILNGQKHLEYKFKFTTLGDIAKKIEMSLATFRKQIQEIYDDIMELNFNSPELFVKEKQQLVSLSFKFWDSSCVFYMGLDTIPKYGESFYFSFVKPKCRLEMFYIESVNHEIKNGKQEIAVFLSGSEPNLYLNLLKDKAYLYKEISSNEYYAEEIAKIEAKLLRMYKNL